MILEEQPNPCLVRRTNGTARQRSMLVPPHARHADLSPLASRDKRGDRDDTDIYCFRAAARHFPRAPALLRTSHVTSHIIDAGTASPRRPKLVGLHATVEGCTGRALAWRRLRSAGWARARSRRPTHSARRRGQGRGSSPLVHAPPPLASPRGTRRRAASAAAPRHHDRAGPPLRGRTCTRGLFGRREACARGQPRSAEARTGQALVSWVRARQEKGGVRIGSEHRGPRTWTTAGGAASMRRGADRLRVSPCPSWP